jgi:Spy/CpxP family protein refolding chaperone
MDKAIASLRIDQQAALRRFQSEQLRVTRLNAMTQSMTLAGLSLTPEQKTQMEALYTRESRLRTLIIVEAKGASHQARVAHLEAETNDRVEQLLDENQRMALAQVMAGSNSR